jgi:hypothetical protein
MSRATRSVLNNNIVGSYSVPIRVVKGGVGEAPTEKLTQHFRVVKGGVGEAPTEKLTQHLQLK